MNLASYLGQFRGDDPPSKRFLARFEMGDGEVSLVPARADDLRAIVVEVAEQFENNRAVCRANRKHEWYRLHGGFRCRQCGVQVPFPEPVTQAQLNLAIWRTIELDAELRAT